VAREPVTAEAPPQLIYVAAGIVGFAFFLMELVWYRMLGPLLGGSVYTFGLILIVALMGIGLGGAAYSVLFQHRKATIGGFALTCALEAAFMAIPYALGDRIAVLAVLLGDLGALGLAGKGLGWAAIAGILILPAAFMSGVQFPLLIALLGRGGRAVGRHVGMACAWNTVGAIIGSLAGGFGLLPWLGAPATWRAVIILLVGLSLAALFVSARTRGIRLRLAAPLVAASGAMLCLAVLGPTAAWRHSPIGAGLVNIQPLTVNGVQAWMNRVRREVVWDRDGVEASIAIVRPSAGLAFFVNGKSDGGIVSDAAVNVMLGLLGALLHEEAATGLVVGLGAGQSAGWLAQAPSMKRVDVVEIEPAVDEMARRCKELNWDVLNHPKVRRIYNDAREVLMTTRERYDVIASAPSNPYRAGIADLYTAEFYGSVRSRLNPGGMFLQWLQGYSVDSRTVRTVLATLASVFPYVEIWQTKVADIIMVCSMQPIRHDVPMLRERIRQEPYRSACRQAWRVNDVEGLLSRHIAGPALAQTVAAQEGGRINTDDRNIVEYGFARKLGSDAAFQIMDLRMVAAALEAQRPDVGEAEVDWDSVEDQRVHVYVQDLQAAPLPPYLKPEQIARGRALSRYAQFRPFAPQEALLAGVVAAWEQQPRKPVHHMEVVALAHAYAYQGAPEALPLLERLEEFEPQEALALRARHLWRRGETGPAAEALAAALRAMRRDPWPTWAVLTDAIALAPELAGADRQLAPALYDALSQPFAAYIADEDRQRAAVRVAAFISGHAVATAIEAFGPNVPWEEPFLKLRADVFRAIGHPLATFAQRQYDQYAQRAGKRFHEAF
jgi:spermidine synthase